MRKRMDSKAVYILMMKLMMMMNEPTPRCESRDISGPRLMSNQTGPDVWRNDSSPVSMQPAISCRVSLRKETTFDRGTWLCTVFFLLTTTMNLKRHIYRSFSCIFCKKKIHHYFFQKIHPLFFFQKNTISCI